MTTASTGSFAPFSNGDGNNWLLQQVTQRLPGRASAGQTTFTSTADLAAAQPRPRCELAGLYADYVVREQHGEKLPD